MNIIEILDNTGILSSPEFKKEIKKQERISKKEFDNISSQHENKFNNNDDWILIIIGDKNVSTEYAINVLIEIVNISPAESARIISVVNILGQSIITKGYGEKIFELAMRLKECGISVAVVNSK